MWYFAGLKIDLLDTLESLEIDTGLYEDLIYSKNQNLLE